MVPENQSEHNPTAFHSEGEDGCPGQSTVPLLQVSPVCSPTEYRRLSDTSISPLSEASNENLTLPVLSGRRHSDLSSLTSHHHHHSAIHRGPTCQACLALLILRSQDGNHCCPSVAMPTYHCPCDFRHHPLPGGTMNTSAYGHSKVSSDYSNFSMLQQSLFNIISRKAVHPTQASLLHTTAALRPAHSDGDCSLRSHPEFGCLANDQELPQESESKFFAREQQVTKAAGVVGHNSKQVALVPPNGANTCLIDFFLSWYIAWSWSDLLSVHCLRLAASRADHLPKKS